MLYLIMNDTETGGFQDFRKVGSSVGARPHRRSGSEVHEKILKIRIVKQGIFKNYITGIFDFTKGGGVNPSTLPMYPL